MFEGYDFNAFFQDVKRQRILIIGDVMIDTYLWGKVERVSPEAPVPIVSDIIEENRLGGAANVALNIKAMGAVPILCSVIGGDERGKLFLDLLEEQNLSDVGIKVDDYRITTQKTRVISGFKHLLRVDEEIDNPLSLNIQEEFAEVILSLIENRSVDAVIIQDYDKGVVTEEVIKKVDSATQALDIPVMVDPKFRNFHEFSSSAIFKPNLKEFKKGLLLDLGKHDVEALIDAGKEFLSRGENKMLLLTLSSNGILVLTNEEHVHIPPFKRNVTDVSGAGDTVIAIATLCYNSGMTPRQIAALANLAGGQVVEKSGVVPVDADLLKEECLKYL